MEQDTTLTRARLAEALYMHVGISHAECATFTDSVIETMRDALQAGSLKFPHLGTFKVVQKRARVGRNPKTKEVKPISARNVLTFTPAISLRRAVNAVKN